MWIHDGAAVLCVGMIEADLSGEVIDALRMWLRPESAFAGFWFPSR